MRVGLDARPFLFSRTGIGRNTGELIRALGQLEGLELLLLGDSLRDLLDRSRVEELLRVSGARLFRRRIPGRLLPLLGWLGHGVDRRLGGIDLFHHTDLVYPPVHRARTVMTLHDVSFELEPSFHGADFRRDVPPRVRRALAGAAAVIVPSRETERQLVERCGIPARKIRVLPLGADHALRPERTDPRLGARRLGQLGIQRPYLLSVGTLEPRKNHLRLLDAFARFRRERPERPHQLVLAGGFGWLDGPVRARLRETNADGRIVHLPDLDDGDLMALYDLAEQHVYPSLYEGFGLPVLESMARGVATITSRRGSLPEVGGDAVLYADPEDPEELAGLMALLTEDDARRRELAEAGRNRARRFRWSDVARGHLEVYRSVLQD